MDLLYLSKVLKHFHWAKTFLVIEIKKTLPSKFIWWYLLSTCYMLVAGDILIKKKIKEVFALGELTVWLRRHAHKLHEHVCIWLHVLRWRKRTTFHEKEQRELFFNRILTRSGTCFCETVVAAEWIADGLRRQWETNNKATVEVWAADEPHSNQRGNRW